MELRGKSNLACSYMYLGKTAILYVDELEEALKVLVKYRKLQGKYFNDWAGKCAGSCATNREGKLDSKSFGK